MVAASVDKKTKKMKNAQKNAQMLNENAQK